MSIVFNDETKEFHLYNDSVSYIFGILKNNQLGHLYYGKKIKHRESYKHLLKLAPRPLTVCQFEGDSEFSLDYIKQEYPTYGTSDYSEGAFQIKQENGSIITDYEYKSYRIYSGKPKLMDGKMPATYVENNNEATTLEIILVDKLINSELILTYTIYENRNVITRNTRFINNGNEKLIIQRALSACVDFDDKEYEMIQLSGAWARERHLENRLLNSGIQAISSTRGASSANHNPFLALKRADTTEHCGEVYGFNLVYSGNFLAQVEVNHYDRTRMTMGINPFNFEWLLESGQEFQTPEVVMVFSGTGLNGMSQTYHKLYQERLIRGRWRDERCPVLINNWEATYFDFNEEKIVTLAKVAKEVGIELFVLDDGWFQGRNNDKAALGDWFVDYNKLPNGIAGLGEKINEIGMEFGLWIEPEMVNKISNLYEEHPDWIISTPNRRESPGRNQFVLDFSREEVVEYIYNMIAKILEKAPISYIKWDMNRSISEPYSDNLPIDRQGEMMHRYILGVYNLYERLTTKFPQILFESCASGGGRFDPGMLYYSPQAWTSDDTDAMERLKIQYGTSLIYPLKSMGSHVSAVPNHQIGRATSLPTRANVAYFGTFGYELDITKCTDTEMKLIKQQIEFFKKYSSLIYGGDFYRLESPFEKNITSWMVVSRDKKEAIVGIYQCLAKPNPRFERIRLQGLNDNFNYTIDNMSRTFYGDELMNIGFIFDEIMVENDLGMKEVVEGKKPMGKFGFGDYSSQILVLKSK
ncbi:alpha-galactosidase [Vallitalea sediminicola]